MRTHSCSLAHAVCLLLFNGREMCHIFKTWQRNATAVRGVSACRPSCQLAGTRLHTNEQQHRPLLLPVSSACAPRHSVCVTQELLVEVHGHMSAMLSAYKVNEVHPRNL
jgi:hypothetical protein